MGATTKALHDQLNGLWAQFMELATRADDETKHDGQPYAETRASLDALSDQLDQMEVRLARQGRLTPTPTGQVVLNGKRFEFERGTPEGARFERVLREGMPRGDAAKERVKLASPDEWPGLKAMTEADATTGGFMSSQEFSHELLAALVDASPFRSLVRVVPTTAATYIQPVRSATPVAKRVAETGSRAPTGDVKFRAGAFTTSELMASVLASRAVLMDAQYDLAGAIASAAADQFAVAEGAEIARGSGAGGEMLGLRSYTGTLGAAGNVTATDATGHAFNAIDIVKLVHEGVKAVYAQRGHLIMTLKSLGLARHLKTTDGQFLYLPGNAGYGPTLLDVPVTVIPDLAEVDGATSGLDLVYFGDFRTAFTLVDRSEVVVLRLVERYAETGQVLFIVYKMVNGGVVVPEAISRLVSA